MLTNIIRKTKKSIIVLLGFVVALLIGAATRLQQSTVHADAVQFKQVGASVRMSDQTGIRFSATINQVDETSKYYVMIIPEAWVTTYGLNEVGNEDYYDVLYQAGKRSESSIATDYEAAAGTTEDPITMLVMQSEPTLQGGGEYAGLYLVRGSIVKLQYENSNTRFFGVAFEQKADGTRVYADGQEEYSYRSITNVASAALNDTTVEYSDENKASLNKMVKDAYNVSLGNAENAQVDLPEMSVHSNAALAIQNGSTYQASVNGLPDIGIKVDWRLVRTGSSTDMDSFIDENGKITVLDEDITCNGYAKVLGNEISFKVNPTAKPETGVLEDFSSSSTRYSLGRGGVASDGNINCDATLADISGVSANGLAGSVVWRSSTVDKKDATFRFALSAEDLKEAINEAESVTVRMMVGTYYRFGNVIGETTITAKNYDGDSAEKGYVKFVGRDFVVPHNTWVDLTVTKTEFLNFFEGATETEKLNNFSVLGANNGTGIAGFTVCESYTINGSAADCEMLFDAIYTNKATTVAPLASTAVRMNINVKGGAYVESKTDKNEVTVNDIVCVTESSNNGIKAKFGLTAEELSSITSLSFKVLVVPSVDETLANYIIRYNRGGGEKDNGLVQQSGVNCNEWTTITYTKAQLCQKILYPYGNATKNEDCSADNGWTDFCNAFCSSGDFSNWFISGVNADNPPIIYIADVTFNYNN